MTHTPSLAILGAGKVGTTIGRIAARAGWDVRLTGSPRQSMQALIVETLVPGGRLLPEVEAVDGADIVIIAVPFAKVHTLGWDLLDGKIVIDASNYWDAVDGTVDAAENLPDGVSTTSLISQFNPRMRLVKSFNHLGYDDLEADARPRGHAARRAMVVAGDDGDVEPVAALIDALGFDPLVATKEAAHLLEPDGPIFAHRLDRSQVQQILVNVLGKDVTRIPELS